MLQDMAKIDDLATEIERQIRTGQLAPGDRLAPVRQLADDRGLAPNTVAAVYKTLAARGLVQGEGRRGTFVTSRPALRTPVDEPVPDHLVDMARGNPDPTLFPDLAAALKAVPSKPLLYGSEQVLPTLAAAFRSGFDADRVDSTELAVVAGALDGIERVLGAHLRPGDKVGVEDPGYSSVTELVIAMGLRPTPVAVDAQGPTPAGMKTAIEEGIAAVIVTPRAQNPTGCAVDQERASELRQLLQRHPEVLAIEDDHAGPISGADYHSIIPELVDRNSDATKDRRWAVVRSVAKSLGPDLRVSALAGDATTIARVRGRQALGTGWVSHILQHIVASMLTRSDHQATVAAAAATYAKRRNALQRRLAEHGIPTASSSGLNVWIPVDDEASVVSAMERRGYVIRSGASFRMDSPPGVRVTVAGHDHDVLVAAADAMADILTPRSPRRGA